MKVVMIFCFRFMLCGGTVLAGKILLADESCTSRSGYTQIFGNLKTRLTGNFHVLHSSEKRFKSMQQTMTLIYYNFVAALKCFFKLQKCF